MTRTSRSAAAAPHAKMNFGLCSRNEFDPQTHKHFRASVVKPRLFESNYRVFDTWFSLCRGAEDGTSSQTVHTHRATCTSGSAAVPTNGTDLETRRLRQSGDCDPSMMFNEPRSRGVSRGVNNSHRSNFHWSTERDVAPVRRGWCTALKFSMDR